MAANPIELIGGLADASDVSKPDMIAWGKARVAQVMANVGEIRATTLAGQQSIGLLSTGDVYLLDTADFTTSDDGINCIISSDGYRFKAVGGVDMAIANVSFAVSASAGALTIALKTALGNDPSAGDPIKLGFRSATQTSSALTRLLITAAKSITIPATSTLGFASATAGRLWITAWNDGGTLRLGVFNASDASTIYPIDESLVASSLQAVAGGNTAGQHYTAGAAVTSKAFRVLGYVDWTSSGVATAGTWTTTNLNSIQVVGPGVKRPGDVLQVKQVTTTSQTTNTTATYADTALTHSPTLRAAANLVEVLARGSGQHNTSSAGVWARVLESVSGQQVGDEELAQNNAAAPAVVPISLGGLVKPNTKTPTVKVQIKCNVNTNTAIFPGVGTAVMIVKELMG